MYVIVLQSKFTEEIFGVQRTMSNEPCRFQDYAVAQRAAHEKNEYIKTDEEYVWVVKSDDGIYYKRKREF